MPDGNFHYKGMICDYYRLDGGGLNTAIISPNIENIKHCCYQRNYPKENERRPKFNLLVTHKAMKEILGYINNDTINSAETIYFDASELEIIDTSGFQLLSGLGQLFPGKVKLATKDKSDLKEMATEREKYVENRFSLCDESELPDVYKKRLA